MTYFKCHRMKMRDAKPLHSTLAEILGLHSQINIFFIIHYYNHKWTKCANTEYTRNSSRQNKNEKREIHHTEDYSIIYHIRFERSRHPPAIMFGLSNAFLSVQFYFLLIFFVTACPSRSRCEFFFFFFIVITRTGWVRECASGSFSVAVRMWLTK